MHKIGGDLDIIQQIGAEKFYPYEYVDEWAQQLRIPK